MKRIDRIPILVTGPFLGSRDEKIISDRVRFSEWLRNYHHLDNFVRIIFPDDLSPERYDENKVTIEYKFLSEFLFKRSDSFEYILSRVVSHHFNFHLTSAAIFELGQFHSKINKGRTTVFVPEFLMAGSTPLPKTLDNLNEKYKTSEYIKTIYKKNIVYYDGASDMREEFRKLKKLKSKTGIDLMDDNLYFDSHFLSWDIHFPTIDLNKESLLKKHSKIVLNQIRKSNLFFALRKYKNNSKTISEFITYQYATGSAPKNIVRIPLRQLFIIFESFYITNKGIWKLDFKTKPMDSILLIMKNFMEYLMKNISCHPLIKTGFEIKYVFSKSRASTRDVIASFMWMIENSPIDKISESEHENFLINIWKQYLYNDEYYTFNLMRKKNGSSKKKAFREITTYSKNIYGDNRKIEQKELLNDRKKQLSISEFSFAYSKGKTIFDAIKVHSKVSSFLKIDISDFFETIYMIKSADTNDLSDFYEYKQGTVMAPINSNKYMEEFDSFINGYIKDNYGNATYTRYSDDILISFSELVHIDRLNELKYFISEELKKIRLDINENKVDMADGNEDFSIKYLGFNYRFNTQGASSWWLPTSKSRRLMNWTKNPEKFGLTKKYIQDYIRSLKDNGINYRWDKIIDAYLDV